MTWNPGQYEKFKSPRLQPGLDLLHRVPDLAPKRILDLGCGAGALMPALAARFPGAVLTGLDNSSAMLERAQSQHGDLASWIEADLSSFQPKEPFDLIYSNAVLQWLPDHEKLFPTLMQWLRAGGILAVQMPRNHPEPSHSSLREITETGPWAAKLSLDAQPVGTMRFYWEILIDFSFSLDLWETQYLHPLEGDDPVYEWTKGTAMTPVIEALSETELATFEAEYKLRLRQAYPAAPSGVTLFPFRRVFMIARKHG